MPLPNAADVTTGGPAKELSKDDILDLISAPDEEEKETIDLKEEKSVKKEKEQVEEEKEEEIEEQEEEKEEEKDELAELEEELELEEKDEDELELIAPVRRKEILAKYPKLFKDFPYLEKAYYREQKFTELYPTFEDANVAKTKAETLDKFESNLIEGDLTEILQATKDENKESFNKIADNYLLSLSKVDEGAYHHVIGNIIKATITNMVREARGLGENEGRVLQNAASILNQFVFGTSQFTRSEPLSKSTPEKSDRERELEQKEEKFRKERFESARTSLDTKVDNVLKATISANIDKNDSMTPYVKRNAEREALEYVYERLDKDTRFKAIRDKLWQNAYKNDYDSSSMEKLLTAIKSVSKTLLPTAIKKARNEALKGMGKRIKTEDSEEFETEKESPQKRESAAPRQRTMEKKGDIPKDMSNKDYIMQG